MCTLAQNGMGKCGVSRLDFTLRLQLPAGSCYQPHSRAHVRDRLTLERPSALTERKLAPATTFALTPKRAPSSSAVRRTAALNSTCFLLFLLWSAKRDKKNNNNNVIF